MEDCSSGDNRTVFAALPCLASGRSMVLRTAFSTGSYQSLNAVVASVLFVIGMGGRMLYVYLCCGRDEKKGARRLGRNMLYGLFWGGRFVGIVYECGSRFSLLAECVLYFCR